MPGKAANGNEPNGGFLILRTFGGCVHNQSMYHISDHDLERFHLSMVQDEAELAIIEEHLLVCSDCIDAAEEKAKYVDTIRAAIIAGNFDLA
jgi:hypothetical protein